MYCRVCGNELKTNERFCSKCASPVDAWVIAGETAQRCSAPPAPSPSTGNNNVGLTVACVILGVVFILCGIIPYFLRPDFTEYNLYISSVCSEYDASAVFSLVKFVNIAAPLFFFIPSALSVLSGALLIKKRKGVGKYVTLTLTAHALSMLRSLILFALVRVFPEYVISLSTNNTAVAQAGRKIFLKFPGLLYAYEDIAVAFAVASVIAVALSVVILALNKGLFASVGIFEKGYRHTLGIPLLLLLLVLTELVGNAISTSVVRRYYGTNALSASVVSDSAFDGHFAVFFAVALLVAIAFAVLLDKAPSVAYILPSLLVLVVVSVVFVLLAKTVIFEANAPDGLVYISVEILRGRILSAFFVTSAALLWFSAVAKGKAPLWLQILIPMLLPVLSAVCDIFSVLIKRTLANVNTGYVIFSLIIAAASVVCLSVKQRER